MVPTVTGTVALAEYGVALAALVIGSGAHHLAHRAAAAVITNRRVIALAPLVVFTPAAALLAVALTFPAIEIGSLLILLAWLAVTVPTWRDWATAVPALHTARSETETEGRGALFTYAVLAYTLALAFILRVFRLDAEAYYIDETITLFYATEKSALELVWFIPFRQPHVPLYYVFMHGWTAAFGTAEFVTRLPSVGFSVALVGALFVAGRRCYSDRVGLLAAFLAAVSPFQIIYAQWARMYALLGLLAVIGTWLAFEVVRDTRYGRLAYYLTASAALTATHVYGIFLLLAHWTWFASRYPAADGQLRRRLRRAVAGSALLASPWVAILTVKTVAPGWYGGGAVMVGSIDGAFPYMASDAMHLAAAPAWWLAGYRSGAVLWAFSAIVLLLTLWAIGAVKQSGASRRWLAVWLVVPLAIALGISAVHPIFKFKHGMVVAPAVYLAFAVGLARRRRLVIGVVLAALVVTSGAALVGDYSTDRYRPYDDAVEVIETHGEPGDLVLGRGRALTPPGWYAREAGLRYLSLRPRDGRTVAEVTAGEDCVWLLYDWPGDTFGEDVDAQLNATYTLAYEQEFTREKDGFTAGILLKRYTKGGGCHA